MQETQEMQIQPLGWEDPLEEEMATHSSFLVWKIPWTEEPGGLPSVGSQRDTTEWLGTAQLNTARRHKRGLQWNANIATLPRSRATPKDNWKNDLDNFLESWEWLVGP